MANPAKITTYALLQNAIEDTLNRTDLDDEGVSALCIQLAEAEFDRRIKSHKRRTRSTASMSTQYTDLPDDWHSPITVRLTGANKITPLRLISPVQMMHQRATGGERSGRPQMVSIAADTLEVWPTPDSTYTVEMHYWARIPKLTDSNTTNWLLDSYPDIYLHGSLASAEAYLRNDERVPLWRALMDNGIADMNKEFSRSYGPAVQMARTFG